MNDTWVCVPIQIEAAWFLFIYVLMYALEGFENACILNPEQWLSTREEWDLAEGAWGNKRPIFYTVYISIWKTFECISKNERDICDSSR